MSPKVELEKPYTIKENDYLHFLNNNGIFNFYLHKADDTVIAIFTISDANAIVSLNDYAGQTISKISFYINSSSTSATKQFYLSPMIINNVSTQVDYEPYTEQTQLLSLGSIELAKIGDYTDKIFKAVTGDSIYDSLDSTTKASLNVGSWYKQGNIGKKIVNENTPIKQTQATAPYRYRIECAGKTNASRILLLSSHFEISELYSHDIDLMFGGGMNENADFTYFQFSSTSTDKETTAKVKAWLENNNVTIYYALATPTYTEITDQTLLAQLENILKMHTNKNVTNGWIEPTGTNAQGDMVLVYRQDIGTLITNNTNAILSL